MKVKKYFFDILVSFKGELDSFEGMAFATNTKTEIYGPICYNVDRQENVSRLSVLVYLFLTAQVLQIRLFRN